MSGEICHDCAIKPNKGIKKLIPKWSCGQCNNGIKPKKCNDCGDILVYCEVMKYYHSTSKKVKKCGWFEEK